MTALPCLALDPLDEGFLAHPCAVHPAAASRDPRHWDGSERFDITRPTSGHVGFGIGIHQCLGQMVAWLEAEMVLNAMIPRIANIRATGLAERHLNNMLHAIAHSPVVVEPA